MSRFKFIPYTHNPDAGDNGTKEQGGHIFWGIFRTGSNHSHTASFFVADYRIVHFGTKPFFEGVIIFNI